MREPSTCKSLRLVWISPSTCSRFTVLMRPRRSSLGSNCATLLFRSLRSLDVGDFRRARLHGCGEHVIDLSPGGANLRCEILTEPALEGPEQPFSDEPVMFRRHAITRMAGPKRFHRRNELI